MSKCYSFFIDAEADWRVERHQYRRDEDGFYESLFALSTGRIGLRATVDFEAGGGHPGFFHADLYGPGITVPRQLINGLNPAWWRLRVGGLPVSPARSKVVCFRQWLDLAGAHHGWSAVLCGEAGGETKIEMRTALPSPYSNLIISEMCLQPLDHEQELLLELAIDWSSGNGDLGGTMPNLRLYHLGPGNIEADARNFAVCVQNLGSEQYSAAACAVIGEAEARGTIRLPSRVGGIYAPACGIGAICLRWITASVVGDAAALDSCCSILDEALTAGVQQLLKEHTTIWRRRWQQVAEIEGPAADVEGLRYGQFQLLQSVDRSREELNVAARGLTSEYHSGHFFFNTELYLLPYFSLTEPDIARAMLRWRINRLDAAIKHAADTGYSGARFPEEADDRGYPAAPKEIRDLFAGHTARECSGEQVMHISADLLHALRRYFLATGDTAFVYDEAIHLIGQCARYLADLLTHDPEVNGRGVRGVMGFDEFHYNVNHHYATNFMASRELLWATKILDAAAARCSKTESWLARLGFDLARRNSWQDAAREVYLPAPDDVGVIPVFEGYFELPDQRCRTASNHALPVMEEADRKRADALLPFQTRLTKQADVVLLMTLYPEAFSFSEVAENLDYYEPRTVHGSSLSLTPHACAAARVGRPSMAHRMLRAAARYNLDFEPRACYNNGVHIASYAGVWVALLEGLLGFQGGDGFIELKPSLPEQWSRISMSFCWQKHYLKVTVRQDSVEVVSCPSSPATLQCQIFDAILQLHPGSAIKLSTNPARED